MKLITAFVVVVGLAVLLGGGYLMWDQYFRDDTPAFLDMFVERPYIVVTGKNFSRVEVWAIPTGTEIKEEAYQKLGDATKNTQADDGAQRWSVVIPSTPMLVTEVFAKGFDKNGNAAGTISLPQKGATEISQALWEMGEGSTITWVDSGATFVFTPGARFSVTLDRTRYPDARTLECAPGGVISAGSNRSDVLPPLAARQFEAMAAGACTLRTGDFSATIRVVADVHAAETFRDRLNGFLISYSPMASKSSLRTSDLLTGTPILRLDVTRNAFAGTNLSEASVIIGASPSAGVVSRCLKADLGERAVGERMISGVSFAVFEKTGAAAGNRYDTESYRAVHNNICYEIQEFIHATALENYEPDAVKPFDREGAVQALEAIIATFRFE
jgi:hypothetical protein